MGEDRLRFQCEGEHNYVSRGILGPLYLKSTVWRMGFPLSQPDTDRRSRASISALIGIYPAVPVESSAGDGRRQ